MRKMSILLLAVAFVAVWSAQAMMTPASAEEGKHSFEGAGKCKTCHKSEEQGAQFVKWSEGPHARAYATLGSPEALEIGKKVGVEKPQESDTCLRCHVTGHGAPAELLGAKYDKTEGVGCESCHGAGGDYYKKKTMEEITAGTLDGATVGLMKPTKETCEKCHNDQSPTFKGFDFEKYQAQVAHPWPDAYKKEIGAGGSK